jgi:hypothetical protein
VVAELRRHVAELLDVARERLVVVCRPLVHQITTRSMRLR